MAGSIAGGTGLSTGETLGVLFTSPDPFKTFAEARSRQTATTQNNGAVSGAINALYNNNLVEQNGIPIDKSIFQNASFPQGGGGSKPGLPGMPDIQQGNISFDQQKVNSMQPIPQQTRSRMALESLARSPFYQQDIGDALVKNLTTAPEAPKLNNVFDSVNNTTTVMSDATLARMSQEQPGRFALAGQVTQKQPNTPEIGKLRDYPSGDQRITEEWDGTKWAPKTTAPQWAPNAGKPRIMYDDNNQPIDVEPGMPTDGLSPRPFRVIPQTATESLTTLGTNLDTYERLSEGFKPEYVGKPVVGGAAIQASKMGMGDPGLGNWWSDYQTMVNSVRNDLFGAALTDGEKAEFEKAMITPGMSADASRKNLARQTGLLKTAASRKANGLRAQGYAPGSIENFMGRRIADLPDPMARPDVSAKDDPLGLRK